MKTSYTLELNILKYTDVTSAKYIGSVTTAMLLKQALDSLSIDLRDQFCVVNELTNNKHSHRILITASDTELVDEVVFQFNKLMNTYNLTLIAKHFCDDDHYSLGA